MPPSWRRSCSGSHARRKPHAELALERHLSAYDAAYLLVARATGGALVTFDAKLAAAARAG